MYGTKFYRPARAYPSVLPTEEIVINAPPVIPPAQGAGMIWMQLLLPVVGGIGSFVFIIAFHANGLMIIAGVVMALCSIGSGVAMGMIQRGTQKKQRQLNSDLYRAYLEQRRLHLRKITQLQRQVSERLYPASPQLTEHVCQQVYLWERRPDDLDFLQVRIGVGPMPLCCRVRLDLGNNPMVRYVPELRSLAEGLVNEWSYLDDMPAVIPLRSLGILAVTGQRQQTRSLVQAMLCQVIACQSPEDVRCMVFFPEHDAIHWNWLKWLPHTHRLRQVKAEKLSTPDHLCMLASTIDDVRTVLQQQIKPELDRRRRLLDETSQHEKPAARLNSVSPHLVIVLDGFSPYGPLGLLPEIDELFSEAIKLGATILCLVDKISEEPALLQARLSISSIGRLDFEMLQMGGQRLEGLVPDTITRQECERMARSLAPLSLAAADSQHDLSQDVRLLDLLSIPSADTLQVAETWQTPAFSDIMRIPLGIRADGEPLVLDLKESADKGMGPHGLVVGATGSGKSELLRTIVVGLAAKHDPELVNFVLVDFKGGASFADFATLPHVAGIITNLQGDNALINRAYDAILGEQQRRQRMLHEAGNVENIKLYHARRRLQPQLEPMPYLVIIADEFAELIAQQPDFLDLFMTLGRVGRSLGMHLLFATQRIDEGRIRGLEGHLRYRICLRTFSAAESSSVLGKSDAYYLPSTPGMGYFKVDTDVYQLFKTALISVPFVSRSEQALPQTRIREFTTTGKLIKHQYSSISAAPTTLLVDEASDLHTEMDVVIERLSIMQERQHQKVHQVWLSPLRKSLPLYTIFEEYLHQPLTGERLSSPPPFGPLRLPLGLVDLPLMQAQEPMWLDFSGSDGHLALVGAPQTGKSTFLRTLITSFMVTHTPIDVQLYCIDLGGGLLRTFQNAPHVGVVCGKAERDKVRRVIRQMRKVIEDREFFFREQGIDSMATFRIRRSHGELKEMPFGDVFLMIDNFSQFCMEFDLEAEVTELVATGLTYGVHVVLAANRWAEIRSKVRDNIGTRLELHLNDPLDSEFGKAVAAKIPVGVPGRGVNKEKVPFQVALPVVDHTLSTDDASLAATHRVLETFVTTVRSAWKGEVAPPIRLLPALVNAESLPTASMADQPAGIPLGLEESRLDPLFVDLIDAGPHFLILGDSECGKTTLLRTWMRGVEQRYTRDQLAFGIIDYRKTLLDFADSKNLLAYAYNANTLTETLGNFRVDLEKRLKAGADLPLNQLRSKKRWDGRHYFLFVDDYDALASQSNTPLSPLLDAILAGRDIGFHLVLARRVGGIGRASFEPIIQRLREMGTSALIMSGDAQEGRIIHGQAASPLPPGRGYFVKAKSPATLIQVAYSEPHYVYDEE